jgi:hypothetical protein
VEGDVLGEEFKGYVFKIMGGQDKQVRIVTQLKTVQWQAVLQAAQQPVQSALQQDSSAPAGLWLVFQALWRTTSAAWNGAGMVLVAAGGPEQARNCSNRAVLKQLRVGAGGHD